MNGLIWTQDTRKRTTKPHLSRRFRSLIEQSRKRVLVFKNGNGSSGIEIVANPDRFEDVCDVKCVCNSQLFYTLTSILVL